MLETIDLTLRLAFIAAAGIAAPILAVQFSIQVIRELRQLPRRIRILRSNARTYRRRALFADILARGV